MDLDELIDRAHTLDFDTDEGKWQLAALINEWRVATPDRSLATFVELASQLGVEPEELNH